MGNINFSKIGDSENAVAIVDSRVANRWLDAFGDVDKAIVDSVWKADEFAVTATGTSPITASVLPGAVALVTTGANEYDGDNVQLVGSRFKVESGKPFYFGAKVTLGEAAQSDFLVGLCGVDTTLTNASGSHAIALGAGGIFFSKLDGVTAGYFKTITTATEKNSAAAFTADTSAHVFEIYCDGSKVSGYVDGVLVGTFGSDITTEVLTPSFNFRAGSAGAKTMTLHWMRAIQVRA